MNFDPFLQIVLIVIVYSGASQWVCGNNTIVNDCFCKLNGVIDNCSCTVETIDSFNNRLVYPKIRELLTNDYFRFYKVNLYKKCQFWHTNYQCSMQYCNVEHSDRLANEIEHNLRQQQDIYEISDRFQCPSSDLNSCELNNLNTSISQESYKDFDLWKEHDSFCVNDNDADDQAEYTDLLINPERYTGYGGESAHTIWKSIYRENCFWSDTGNFRASSMCFEKIAFYRLVSGLHSSINTHLSANYLLRNDLDYVFGREKTAEVWGANVHEFRRRFSAATTENGQGPQWLQNLYFVYLVELRALAKASRYFETHDYFTGRAGVDDHVRKSVRDFLDVVRTFPDHFNESSMFNDANAEVTKRQFRNHFRNITRIMDCVDCIKCRLWGKLQTQGLGTALQILFSDQFNTMRPRNVRFERSQIVALFNAFGKLSTSIHYVEQFRKSLT